MSPRIALVAVAIAVLAAAGCSDGDSAGGGTTSSSAVPVTSLVPVTTSSPTPPPMTEPSTTSETSTASAPPTTVVDVEALKGRIAADYERAFYRYYELVAEPRMRNLKARVAEVSARGSPQFDAAVDFIEQLVTSGDRVVQDPNVLWVEVEEVELVGEPPYRQARLQTCEVFEAFEAFDSGEIEVLRTVDIPVRLTANGWLGTATELESEGFPGERRCPPD